MDERPGVTEELLRRASQGDAQAIDALFSRYREALSRLVHFRIDRRLRGRMDTSDVVQEACLEAVRRIDDYLRDPRMPFFLWLRFITRQKLVALHRNHLGVQARDPRREVRPNRLPSPSTTSVSVSERILSHLTPPADALARAETQRILQDALDRMDPVDREVLVLRHFEQLTNAEIAHEIGMDESAASKRYFRALKKIRGILARFPGWQDSDFLSNR